MLKLVPLFLFFTQYIFGGGDSLKVMTYNLLGMSPGSEPEVRILHIIDNLIGLDPDIIGLQEINESLTAGGIDNQAKVIADSLSSYFGIPYYYYYEFTHLAWWDQFREFVGIISKYPVEETGYRQLTAGVFPRKVVWNKINTPIGTVNVFTTHLSAFNLWEIRIQQVQQIISFVDSIELQHPVIASILTGDFNDPPDSTSIQQLTNTGTDTFYVMTYAYVNPTDPGYTVPSNQPTSKIDYVFIKNTGGLEPFESAVVMKEPYAPGKFCSDHLGVLTSFREGVLYAEDDSFIQPMEIELFQNYPNPFNPTTVIKYQVPELSFVTIKVYDVLGNDVAILVKEEKTAGSYEVHFDGTRLTSGVYFYTMRATNFIDTKKIMLIK